MQSNRFIRHVFNRRTVVFLILSASSLLVSGIIYWLIEYLADKKLLIPAGDSMAFGFLLVTIFRFFIVAAVVTALFALCEMTMGVISLSRKN